jgi:hypothetical protein
VVKPLVADADRLTFALDVTVHGIERAFSPSAQT